VSTTIDQKVVEMRFDNKNFEANVATTMSTLDKFKQKLNLSGATKGLEEINSASKRIDMSSLGTAVDTVRTKFSALEVMGVTALANITNSVVNASKRMLRSFTVEPIKTGFNEYELKMGAIQTIMASTGESLDYVNQKLNELNKYSDDTIYSFQDMTQNIGKFTNAGVKLDDAVAAIKGISNEAAISGANATEASHAMYNLAQALSSGYVKLLDWKSVENANMSTVGFKEQLMETAVEMGTLTKVTDGYKTSADTVITPTKNFNESLQEQWMTSDVLIETLKRYADETTDIGKKATEAATEVKTFSQMMDTLKESAQSGWAQSWEIIFGDFEEGKTLWTSINNVLGGFIDKMSDTRNSFLINSLGSSWDKLYEKLDKANIKTTDFQEKLKETAKKHGIAVDELIEEYGSLEKAMAAGKVKNYKDIIKETIKSFLGLSEATEEVKDKTEDYAEIVKKVIRGDFGNGAERVKKLTEAGYDYAKVQNKVNEELGYSYRHLETLTEEQKKNADSLVKLSDEQLKSKGYTEEQVKALRELEKAADETGSSIDELITGVTEMSGRDKLLHVFSTIGKSISDIFGAIKKAWNETFETKFSASDILSGIIDSLYNMSDALAISEKSIGQIERIVKGFFAITKLFASFHTKLLFVGFDIIKGILGITNVDLLEFAARIGDGIVKIKNMIFNSKLLDINLEKIADTVVGLIETFVGWFKTFASWPGVAKSIDKIKESMSEFASLVGDLFSGKITISEFFTKIWDKITASFDKLIALCPGLEQFISLVKELFNSFKTSDVGSGLFDGITGFFESVKNNFKNGYDIGKNVVEGIINGLKDGTITLGTALLAIGKMIIDVVCKVLGIHSPSTEGVEIGKNFIQGIINGIKDFGLALWDVIKGLFGKLVDFAKNIDFGAIVATGFGVGILLLVNKVINIADKIVNPLDKLGGLFDAAKSLIKNLDEGFNKYLKAKVWESRSQIIFNIAKSVALLAASVALLAYIPADRLWPAIGAVGALVGMLAALAVVYAVLDKCKIGDTSKSSLSIISMAGSLLILAVALKVLASIESEDMGKSLIGLAGTVVGLSILVMAIGKMMSLSGSADMIKVGGMLLMVSGAMLIMVKVIKGLSQLDNSAIAKGMITIAAIELLFAGIIAVSKLSGEHASKAGSMLLKMSIAMGIMVIVIKMISYLEPSEIAKGLAVVGAIELLFMAVIAVSKLAGQNATKAGTMLFLMSGAMLIMTYVVRQISELSDDEIKRGLAVVAGIELLFAAVIAVSKFAGQNAPKAGSMLILMSGALLILTGALFVISHLAKDPSGLYQAVGVVAILELLFMGLIKATEKVPESMASLIVITVAIAVLTGALVALYYLADDKEQLMSVTAALSSVIIAFGLLVAATKYATSLKGTTGSLVTLLGVVIVLSGVVAALTLLPDVNSALKAAGAISILMLTLAASFAIISIVGPLSKGALKQIGGMLLVVAGLAAMVALLTIFDINPSIETAVSMSVLLLALSAACLVVSRVPVAAATQGAIGLAAFIGIMGGILLALGGLSKIPGFNDLIADGGESLSLIGYAIGNFVGSIIGGLGAGITSGLPDIGTNLSDFMKNLTPFIEGANKIDPSVSENIKTLAQAFLIFTAAEFIDSLPLFGNSTLSDFGKELAAFAPCLAEFAKAVSGLDAHALTAMDVAAEAGKKLAEMLKSLPNSGGKIAEWFGDNTADEFGKQLEGFGKSLILFGESVNGIDQYIKSIETATTAGKALSELANSIPESGGFIADFFGDNTVDDFGTKLKGFGDGLVAYGESVSGVEQYTKSMKAATSAGQALAELADAIPESGGFIADFFGDNSIDTFGANLAAFGNGVKLYGQSVVGIESYKEGIEASKDVVTLLIEIANTIKDKLNFDFGESEMSKLGSSLMIFANGTIAFSASMNTVGDLTAINDKVNSLVTIVNNVKDNLKWDAGKSEIVKVGDNLSAFGASIVSFCTNMYSIGDVSAIQTKVDSLVSIVNNVKDNLKWDAGKSEIVKMGTDLASFGSNLEIFDNAIGSVSVADISSISSAINELIRSAKELANTDFNSLSSLGNNLGKIGDTGITKFVNAFTKGQPKVVAASTKMMADIMNSIKSKLSSFHDAGANVMTKFLSGITKQQSKIVKTTNTIVASAAATAGSVVNYLRFYSAGKYVVDGFAAGITANTWKAEAKASAMANAAEKAAKEALDINSPSKVFRKLGFSVPEGFAMGIDKLGGLVKTASVSMTDVAVSSVGDSIARIAGLVNDNIDAQPTIRPVLDLSDVKSGVGTLGGMLNFGPSVDVLANVGAINTAMNRRLQNGSTNDVVTAIKKLGKDIGNMERNSYNINGLTYEEGSDVADALNTIVRAAIRERRV
jgi:tape measure domain-containing protein